MAAKSYTREELIALCEAALVPEERWHDRDSHSAQVQVGECWALLRAGCDFKVITRRDGCDKVVTDAKTVWLYTYARGFNWHECWSDENDRDDFRTAELHYLPTAKRLREAAGGDWY